MSKLKDCCNICRVIDEGPLVSCAICKFPYHMKCVQPKLTIKNFDTILATPGFYYYCPDHHNLSAHKVLQKFSSMESKFFKYISDISEDLSKFREDVNKFFI